MGRVPDLKFPASRSEVSSFDTCSRPLAVLGRASLARQTRGGPNEVISLKAFENGMATRVLQGLKRVF